MHFSFLQSLMEMCTFCIFHEIILWELNFWIQATQLKAIYVWTEKLPEVLKV